MGQYYNSEKEIVQELSEALDNIEGDFDSKTLKKALIKLKKYPYTTDNDDMYSKDEWQEYLSEK